MATPRAGSAGAPSRHDPITRISRFCEIMALALVAVSLFLPFSNGLNHPHTPVVTLDNFPTLAEKIAIVAVHTRTPWVVLAIFSTLVAAIAYRLRYRANFDRTIRWAPAGVLLILALHAGALAWLHSHGTLKIEVHGPAPAAVADALRNSATLPASGAQIHVESITRMAFREGTAQEWQLLFGGDLLFAAPVFLAWILRRAILDQTRTPL